MKIRLNKFDLHFSLLFNFFWKIFNHLLNYIYKIIKKIKEKTKTLTKELTKIQHTILTGLFKCRQQIRKRQSNNNKRGKNGDRREN